MQILPSIVNVLDFKVWVELPTAAMIDIFVCDGDGGGMSVALSCVGNLSVKARFWARMPLAPTVGELRMSGLLSNDRLRVETGRINDCIG